MMNKELLREPLLHFVIAGALLFGVDHVLNAKADPALTIHVGPEVDKEASALFQSSLGRAPTKAELATLRQRWVDNEVLYREGLALRVDQGDPTIRERVIFKALNVTQANISAPQIDEAGLRTWFEQHRANYDEPERYDFLEAVLSGQPSAASLSAFAAVLNKGGPADTESSLRVFKARPRPSLVTSYGEGFAAALGKLQPGQWQVIDSKDGPHLVQLQARLPGQPAAFDTVQGQVRADWIDATMQQKRTDAVRQLARKYTIAMAEPK